MRKIEGRLPCARVKLEKENHSCAEEQRNNDGQGIRDHFIIKEKLFSYCHYHIQWILHGQRQ